MSDEYREAQRLKRQKHKKFVEDLKARNEELEETNRLLLNDLQEKLQIINRLTKSPVKPDTKIPPKSTSEE
jgi:hypothetical protein